MSEDLGMDVFGFESVDEELLEDVVNETTDDADEDQDDDTNVNEEDEDETDEFQEGDEDEGDADSQKNNTSNSLYSTLTTTLRESVPYLKDGEIKTVDDFVNTIEESIEEEISRREFKDLNDLQKTYLDQLKAGIPHETIQAQLQTLDSVNSITEDLLEEDDDLRRHVIKQAWLSKGLSENEAEKLTKRSIDAGADIEDSKDSLSTLKTSIKYQMDKQKQSSIEAKAKADQDRAEAMDRLKNTIDKPEAVIGEKNLTKKVKDAIYNKITTPVDLNGKKVDFLTKLLSENPVEARLKLAYLDHLTDGFNPEKIKALNPVKAKSRATKELDRMLRNSKSGEFNDNTNDDDSIFSGTSDWDLSNFA